MMLNKIITIITVIASYVCIHMAFSVSASACMWSAYQPEEPKCLRK